MYVCIYIYICEGPVFVCPHEGHDRHSTGSWGHPLSSQHIVAQESFKPTQSVGSRTCCCQSGISMFSRTPISPRNLAELRGSCDGGLEAGRWEWFSWRCPAHQVLECSHRAWSWWETLFASACGQAFRCRRGMWRIEICNAFRRVALRQVGLRRNFPQQEIQDRDVRSGAHPHSYEVARNAVPAGQGKGRYGWLLDVFLMGSTFLVMLDVSMKQIGLRLIPVVKTHSKKLSGKGQKPLTVAELRHGWEIFRGRNLGMVCPYIFGWLESTHRDL